MTGSRIALTEMNAASPGHFAALVAPLFEAAADRSVLPTVTARFAVANPEAHDHVPVLLSHGAYNGVSRELIVACSSP